MQLLPISQNVLKSGNADGKIVITAHRPVVTTFVFFVNYLQSLYFFEGLIWLNYVVHETSLKRHVESKPIKVEKFLNVPTSHFCQFLPR